MLMFSCKELLRDDNHWRFKMENDSVPRMKLAAKISYLKCKMRQTAAPSPRLRPKLMILISKSPYFCRVACRYRDIGGPKRLGGAASHSLRSFSWYFLFLHLISLSLRPSNELPSETSSAAAKTSGFSHRRRRPLACPRPIDVNDGRGRRQETCPTCERRERELRTEGESDGGKAGWKQTMRKQKQWTGCGR